MGLKMKRLEKLRDEGAREFCKEWPTEVYHPNDLTTFYEKGLDAATKELMRVIEIQREAFNKVACRCTISEKLSGHLTDCFMPEIMELFGNIDEILNGDK